MKSTSRQIAVFDFDGTLVAKDTFLALLKLGFKSEPWRCVLLLLLCPLFIINFIFRGDRTIPKSVLLWCITAFKTRKEKIRFLTQSLDLSFQNLWFEEGIQKLNELYNEDINIIVATASGQIWVRSLLRKKFSKARLIIGSKLKFFAGGVILASKNCKDNEKLSRIQKELGKDFIWHSTWSDHIADLPILKQAQTPYIVCPKAKHMPIFRKELGKNVQILYWSTTEK